MAIFGRNRSGSAADGLGRGVSSDEAAGDGVMTLERSDVTDATATAPDASPSDASRIVDEVAPKTGGGLFGRSGKAAKPVKPAKVKAAKAAKPAKGAVAASAAPEAEDRRVSTQVLIDFFPDMSKPDAIAMARHWAIDHAKSPSNCSYMVMKVGDGYAIEVQEGVGRAYLPSVVKLAQENPGRLIVVPMVRRKMTIYYSVRNEEFESQVLPERVEPPSMPENPPIYAVRGPTMTPVTKQYREWLIAGGATALIGGLSLLMSVAFYAFDSKSKIPPEWRTTDVAQLPIMQWGRLQADASDSYVVRLEYADGQWRIVRQAVNASVDVSKPQADGSGALVPGSAGAPAATDGTPSTLSSDNGVPASAAPVGAPPPVQGGGVNIPPPGPTGR